MFWQIQALGGPVLAWEMKRATRRNLWRLAPDRLLHWLVVQAVALFGACLPPAPVLPNMPPLSPGALPHACTPSKSEFLDNYLAILLQFQLVLIIAIIPAFTASSLGQEKERGTLFALFGTQLTSRHILLGKLLGRLVLIVPLLLTTLPVLVFIATSDRPRADAASSGAGPGSDYCVRAGRCLPSVCDLDSANGRRYHCCVPFPGSGLLDHPRVHRLTPGGVLV